MASQVVDVTRVGNRIDIERKNGQIERIGFDHRTYVDLVKSCLTYHKKHYLYHKELGEKQEKNLKELLE